MHHQRTTLGLLSLAAAILTTGGLMSHNHVGESDAGSQEVRSLPDTQAIASQDAPPAREEPGREGRWLWGGVAGSPGPPGSRGDRWRWREHEMTSEEREIIIEVIQDLRPLTPENIEQLRQMPAAEFREQMTQRAGRILFLAGLKRTQPDLYELKIEELKVGEAIEHTLRAHQRSLAAEGAPEAREVRRRLHELVARQYELRLQSRAHEIEVIERRVAEMRRGLERDKADREQRVEQRVTELLNREPGARPTPPPPRPSDRRG